MQNSKYLFYVTYQYQFIKYIFLFFYALFYPSALLKKAWPFLLKNEAILQKDPFFRKYNWILRSISIFRAKVRSVLRNMRYARANQGKYMWILKANQRPDLRWCHFFIRNYRKLLRFPYIVTSHIRVRKMNTHVYCV